MILGVHSQILQHNSAPVSNWDYEGTLTSWYYFSLFSGWRESYAAFGSADITPKPVIIQGDTMLGLMFDNSNKLIAYNQFDTVWVGNLEVEIDSVLYTLTNGQVTLGATPFSTTNGSTHSVKIRLI